MTIIGKTICRSLYWDRVVIVLSTKEISPVEIREPKNGIKPLKIL
jgi:hypothetical protein